MISQQSYESYIVLRVRIIVGVVKSLNQGLWLHNRIHVTPKQTFFVCFWRKRGVALIIIWFDNFNIEGQPYVLIFRPPSHFVHLQNWSPRIKPLGKLYPPPLQSPFPRDVVNDRPLTARIHWLIAELRDRPTDRPSAPQAYQCLLSHFLATLGAQEKADCTSMLSSIDSCQNRVSADQYHLTVSRAQVSTHQGRVFFEVIRWQFTCFQMIAGSRLPFF